MKKNSSVFLLLAVLLLGSFVLYRNVPESTRNGVWTRSVLRNWQDFGFWKLSGKLAANPGGQGLPEHPEIYRGHRPACLYPAYFVGWASMTRPSDGIAFHLVLSLLVGIGVWRLLGNNWMALVAAVFTVFSPGYLRLTASLDPLGVPVLLGIPFMCRMPRLLGRTTLTAAQVALIAGTLAIYIPLNWTTIIAIGITIACLALALPEYRKRVLIFTIFIGAACGMVLAISLSTKTPNAASATSGNFLASLNNSYLMGPRGYDGQGMSWTKAGVRLVAVNGVALCPLWLLLLWTIRRGVRDGLTAAGIVLAMTPLWAAVVFVAGMRNYFAHHPWMAGPVLIYGIVFSLRLFLDRTHRLKEDAAVNALSGFGPKTGLLLAAAFVYSLLVLFYLNVASGSLDALMNLVQKHTARQDAIYFAAKDDVWIAQNAQRLAGLIDRALLPLPDVNEPAPSGAKYRLTTGSLPDEKHWLARSELESSASRRFFAQLEQWYLAHVAKRARGDRLEPDATFYLYQLP